MSVQNTGWVSATNAASGVAGVSKSAWNNPANALTQNSIAATYTGYYRKQQHDSWISAILQLLSIGSNIPSTALAITNIELVVRAYYYMTGAGADFSYNDFLTVQPVYGNMTLVGTNKGSQTARLTTSYVDYPYGGDAAYWGFMPTVAQIRGSNFGFAIVHGANASVPNTAMDAYQNVCIDSVLFRVTYTVPDPATLVLSNTVQTFTGTPKSVTVTTTPGGIANSVTYNGSTTPPTNVGVYAVVATITDPLYVGSTTGTLEIKWPETMFLGV